MSPANVLCLGNLSDLVKDCLDGGSHPTRFTSLKRESAVPWIMKLASREENHVRLIETLHSYPTGELPFEAYRRTLICDAFDFQPESVLPLASAKEAGNERILPDCSRYTSAHTPTRSFS